MTPKALALGGFHLWASAGTLMNVDEMVKINPTEVLLTRIDATDTGEGNDQTLWQVEWTAPMDGGAKIYPAHQLRERRWGQWRRHVQSTQR
ncbi:MAG: hypothetical protein Ct9H90mP16_16590 [Candidatus Poseidoniales archaeon]|nr:MAG: hypothetical protein Ct9H90mP16_16590 [Candidatus Poseidoniales archaeon]